MIVDPPDGRMPLTSRPRRRNSARARRPARREPEDRNLGERCISSGVPRLGGPYSQNVHIAQTPDHVLLLHEMIHEFRIVPLDGRPHLPESVRQWLGDARGWWEGDTLVVETTNIRHDQRFRGLSQGSMRLVERFTRVDARHAPLRGDVRGSAALDAAVDGGAADAADRRPDVRVRLPRGERRDDRAPRHRARGGSRGGRRVRIAIEVCAVERRGRRWRPGWAPSGGRSATHAVAFGDERRARREHLDGQFPFRAGATLDVPGGGRGRSSRALRAARGGGRPGADHRRGDGAGRHPGRGGHRGHGDGRDGGGLQPGLLLHGAAQRPGTQPFALRLPPGAAGRLRGADRVPRRHRVQRAAGAGPREPPGGAVPQQPRDRDGPAPAHLRGERPLQRRVDAPDLQRPDLRPVRPPPRPTRGASTSRSGGRAAAASTRRGRFASRKSRRRR